MLRGLYGMQYAPCIAGAVVSFASEEADMWGKGGQCRQLAMHSRGIKWRGIQMTIAVLRNSEGQFLGNIAQKDRQEHCKTLWCWFDGSQANHSDGGESLVVVTTLKSQSSLHGHLLKLNKKS